MANRGRGRPGSRRNNNQLPPAFDQQAFLEAIGTTTDTIAHASAAAGTIAQASATVSQGGPSNLHRFKAHHPPTLGEEGT